jgi:hypothetical protein
VHHRQIVADDKPSEAVPRLQVPQPPADLRLRAPLSALVGATTPARKIGMQGCGMPDQTPMKRSRNRSSHAPLKLSTAPAGTGGLRATDRQARGNA